MFATVTLLSFGKTQFPTVLRMEYFEDAPQASLEFSVSSYVSYIKKQLKNSDHRYCLIVCRSYTEALEVYSFPDFMSDRFIYKASEDAISSDK